VTHKILDNLWQVGGMDFSDSADAAVYLIQFGNSAALIDAGTGYGHGRIKENIAQCLSPDVNLEYLLLTHCHFDHTGGAALVREGFGCKIVAHELDAKFMEDGDSTVTAASWYGSPFAPLAIDVKLNKKETIIKLGDSDIIATHWPGHSPGSLVYSTVIDQQRVVFAQDVHGPIHPSLQSNETQYQVSLKKLLALKPDLLLEGHYGVLQGKEKIADFIRSFMN
jgi:glyoxylase-like metal-dependent hydrolase (beta-lactamase superfamily II)